MRTNRSNRDTGEDGHLRSFSASPLFSTAGQLFRGERRQSQSGGFSRRFSQNRRRLSRRLRLLTIAGGGGWGGRGE